jgi:hypothetical protein
MSEAQIRDYVRSKGLHAQTLERWLSWDRADRDALCQLAVRLKIGENHLRDLMDWLEEIALRDQSEIHTLLRDKVITEIESDPRFGRADKLKRIKEQVRRVRFPRLAQTEDSIRARIQELKLHPEIKVTVPSGLEGGSLRVEFSASNREQLKNQVAKLAEAADKDSLQEIFALLAGRTTEGVL